MYDLNETIKNALREEVWTKEELISLIEEIDDELNRVKQISDESLIGKSIYIGSELSWQVEKYLTVNNCDYTITSEADERTYLAISPNGTIIEIDKRLAKDIYANVDIFENFIYVYSRGLIQGISY